MRDEAAPGQLWEVSNGHLVSGMPRSVTYYYVLHHSDENLLADPSGAWYMMDLETGEIRMRTRLYSDTYWRRLV